MNTAGEVTVEEKLRALFQLQKIDSAVDQIKTLRGELPLEVQDLEDEIEGLETRVAKVNEEVSEFDKSISEKKGLISDSKALIIKYESQQTNVRNNREFDSLSKEIEFQTLEIELAEKRIREAKANIASKKVIIDAAQMRLMERKGDLEFKKKELEAIVGETQKEVDNLTSQSQNAEKVIDTRLLTAYKRLRDNARNGLAVATVERDACGGCYNKVPPQRQLDIATHKKVIVCEHCGRILVDAELATTGLE